MSSKSRLYDNIISMSIEVMAAYFVRKRRISDYESIYISKFDGTIHSTRNKAIRHNRQILEQEDKR